IAAGVPAEEAILAAMIEPLTDDLDVKKALIEVARATLA
ncbi:CbbQ/NirQ/NorQ C-terminal domain-containing protein, partial [Microvirga sp. HBU67558]